LYKNGNNVVVVILYTYVKVAGIIRQKCKGFSDFFSHCVCKICYNAYFNNL